MPYNKSPVTNIKGRAGEVEEGRRWKSLSSRSFVSSNREHVWSMVHRADELSEV